MFDKLEKMKNRYDELSEDLNNPEITSDIQATIRISREMNSLEKICELYNRWVNNVNEIKEAKDVIGKESDEEIVELAKEQLSDANNEKEKLENEIKIELIPKDPNDEKNIFMEIRPAAGGDEAALFAQELMRMYLRYTEINGLKSDIQESQISDSGGLKFAMIKISGKKVYSNLKFESGVHRVQRIPTTESCGRLHTSTVTIAVLPEADDIDFQLDMNDVVLDTYAASSAGGQHANKNETGVRLHHNPTGIIVTCGDSRSQLSNKDKAFSVLKAKLYQLEIEKKQKELREDRLYQIGTGDRSEKIRTYNYPQDRVTDHRIKQSWPNLPGILDGNIQPIIEALRLEEQTKYLK